MHMVGYRRLGDLESPSEVRRGRGRARKHRRYGVPRRVSECAKNRLGVYCGTMLGWEFANPLAFLPNSVGRTRPGAGWQIKCNPMRLRFVFRPPSPRIESGRNHIAAIDEIIRDWRSGLWTNLPRLVIERDWKIQLATEIPRRSLLTNVPHAKRFGA